MSSTNSASKFGLSRSRLRQNIGSSSLNTISSKSAARSRKNNSSSRSRSHVGGPFAVQVILSDGTNATPRPLLPFSFVRENNNAATTTSTSNTNTGNAVSATMSGGGSATKDFGGGPRQNLKAIPINTRHVPAGSEATFWDTTKEALAPPPVPPQKAGISSSAGNQTEASSVKMASFMPEAAQVESGNVTERGGRFSPRGIKGGGGGALSSFFSATKGRLKLGGQQLTTAEDDGTEIETVKLQETSTQFTFILRGSVIAMDASERVAVEGRNTTYAALLETRSQTADQYTTRHTQTLVCCQKNKEIQAARPAVRECGVQATTFDIYDRTYQQQGEEGLDGESNDISPSTPIQGTAANSSRVAEMKVQEYVKVALASRGCLLEIEGAAAQLLQGGEEEPAALLARRETERVVSSSSLANSLTMIERAIQQNINHSRQLRYRNVIDGSDADRLIEQTIGGGRQNSSDNRVSIILQSGVNRNESRMSMSRRSFVSSHPSDSKIQAVAVSPKAGDIGEEEEVMKAKLEKLWSFDSPLTKHRTVHALCWSQGGRQDEGPSRHDHVARDLLAVGYSSSRSTTSVTMQQEEQPNGGLILCWCLRNPQHPERVLHLPTGASALAFSHQHPNLLAAGLMDGSIAIFDLHTKTSHYEPILDTTNLPGRHTDPVWQLKWVDKGQGQPEVLVSISTDGRVMEWSTTKGFAANLLMELKRTGCLHQGKISNQASGLSLDFLHGGDPSIYLVSTEDGIIHKCSVSYNEYYLESYFGHNAPVYRLATSPFYSNTFLSCSADWTAKLWDLKENKPLFNFHMSDLSSVVNDVCWSPHSPTVFAYVTGDGRLVVWDLEKSSIDPLITEAWNAPFPSSDEKEKGEVIERKGYDDGNDKDSSRLSDLGDGDDRSETTTVDQREARESFPPQYTTLAFHQETPIIVVGDAHGKVSCYKMSNVLQQQDLVGSSSTIPPHLMDSKGERLKAVLYPPNH